MTDRLMMDKDGTVTPLPMSTREQMALTIYVELFRFRNSHNLMPEHLCTEAQVAKASVSAADALLAELAKGSDAH